LKSGDRVPTGIAGLDIILNGGLAPGSAYLVEGVPGAGKTTLGLQFIYDGATRYNESGLIITFEEFPEQLERDAKTFGWDLKTLQTEGKLAIITTSPDALIRMMEEPGGPIDQLARAGSLKRVMVDSITHFQTLTNDAAQLREAVFGFINGLRRLGATTLLTKEIERNDPRTIPFEEYLVDGIIQLSNAEQGLLRRIRCVEVTKSRGQPHLAGRSGFRFGPAGIEVFPRLSSSWAANSRWLPEVDGAAHEEHGDPDPGSSEIHAAVADESACPMRISIGVEGIDHMLQGGLIRGSSALVVGTSGTGKTLLCLEFLHAGLAAGEPGVLLTIEENCGKLLNFACAVGLDLGPHVESGLLHVECCSAADITPGEALWRVYRLVRSRNARRVVIDSLSGLFGGECADIGLLQTSTQHLMHLFETMNITTLVTWEIQSITGDLYISDHGLSAIVDTLILLRYVEAGSEMRRVLGIIKARGTDHDHQLREFRITSGGFRVECKLAGFSDVLRGSARGTPKEAVEELLQPLLFIQDVAGMLRSGEVASEQVDGALESLAQEAEGVSNAIRTRFNSVRNDSEPER